MKQGKIIVVVFLALLMTTTMTWGQEGAVKAAPDRGDQGDGPFERLIIRGVYVIDGTGAPPMGPADIVIEGNRIARVAGVGAPKVPIDESRRPKNATKEIQAEGMWVMPGFVDVHVHCGGWPKTPEVEYVYKLWMAHGVTTVRGVSCGPMDWDLRERERSAKNEIVAPRIFAYHVPGGGDGWEGGPILTPEKGREWVRWAATEKKIDGVKIFNFPPEVLEAILDESKKQGLGSVAHLAQSMVAGANAIDAARMGLGTVTHFYGLFESMYDGHDVQPWPVDMIYNDEQHRFGQVARQWNLTYEPGSDEWNALIDEFVELGTTMDPTMTIYSAGRDVMRAREAEWHEKYTLPSLWAYYQPSRKNHGSYWYYWTTWDEVAWRNYYHRWMQFLNDYKNRGGRVTTGSDSGFIYQTYGFGYILELEMLQEAGFHPLEVIRSATMSGAKTLHEPKGKPIDFGVVRQGMLADLVIVEENPIENLKVLYGTGAVKLNDETGNVERVGGIKYTIKDGIVYDAKELLADVAKMVEEQKVKKATEN
jgi:imidazolonepropionase-like amidohydrolase